MLFLKRKSHKYRRKSYFFLIVPEVWHVFPKITEAMQYQQLYKSLDLTFKIDYFYTKIISHKYDSDETYKTEIILALLIFNSALSSHINFQFFTYLFS